jgi:hypothetical protein
VERPEIPLSQRVFGEFVYWGVILAAILCMVGPVITLAAVDNNVMNPHYLFDSIFDGNTAEIVWDEVGGGFPGGHFWLDYLSTGDGFTQFGIVVGCAAALPAVIAVAMVFVFKREKRSSVWVLFSFIIAALITISMLDIISF